MIEFRAAKKLNWRRQRNRILSIGAWIVLIGALLSVPFSRRNLIWAIPVYLLAAYFLHIYRLVHPWGPAPFPLRYLRFMLLPRIPVPQPLLWSGKRLKTPRDAGLGYYEEVEFSNPDGLTLFAWYVPGWKRAAVILVPGMGGLGVLMSHHAALLSKRGYGTLLLDLRAHGRSEGDTFTLGWREVDDVLGAVDYLQRRRDVDADRIGVLGVALGGQIALRAAARSTNISAVVAESPTPAVLVDHGDDPTRPWRWIPYLWADCSYTLRSFLSGEKPPPGVRAEIGAISPRPILLIASGPGKRRRLTALFHQEAGPSAALWEIPEAHQEAAIFAQPTAYAREVGAFFDRALLREPASSGEPAEKR